MIDSSPDQNPTTKDTLLRVQVDRRLIFDESGLGVRLNSFRAQRFSAGSGTPSFKARFLLGATG